MNKTFFIKSAIVVVLLFAFSEAVESVSPANQAPEILAASIEGSDFTAVDNAERAASILEGMTVKADFDTTEQAAFILVSKQEMTLRVFDASSNELMCAPITCGNQFGDKQTIEDNRTPEGVFSIRRIEDSTLWKHKNAKNGNIEYGCYGPWFLRLEVPGTTRIGIHGTNKPEEIGGRTSEGCVRLSNEDIERLVRYARVSLPVIITPSQADIYANCLEKENNKKI